MFNPTGLDVTKASAAGLAVSVLVGVLGGLLVFGAPLGLGGYVVILTPAAAGWLTGKAVHRASGYKQNVRLQLAAGAAVFVSYFVLTALIQVTSPQALIGLAAGVWIASSRLKPPRGA